MHKNSAEAFLRWLLESFGQKTSQLFEYLGLSTNPLSSAWWPKHAEVTVKVNGKEVDKIPAESDLLLGTKAVTLGGKLCDVHDDTCSKKYLEFQILPKPKATLFGQWNLPWPLNIETSHDLTPELEQGLEKVVATFKKGQNQFLELDRTSYAQGRQLYKNYRLGRKEVFQLPDNPITTAIDKMIKCRDGVEGAFNFENEIPADFSTNNVGTDSFSACQYPTMLFMNQAIEQDPLAWQKLVQSVEQNASAIPLL